MNQWAPWMLALSSRLMPGMAGGFDTTSGVDEILQRPGALTTPARTLQALFERDELLQEAKMANQSLLDFLATPAVVEYLLRYAIASGPNDPILQPVPAQTHDTNDTQMDNEANAEQNAAGVSTPVASLLEESIDENSSSITPAHPPPASPASTPAAASPLIQEGNEDDDLDDPQAETNAALSADASSSDDEQQDAAAAPADSISLTVDEDAATPLLEEEELILHNQHRYPYLASELLCSEQGQVCDTIVEDDRLLALLLSLLGRPPPLDPSSVSYFRAVMQRLIQRHYGALVSFCARWPSGIDLLLRHVGLYSLMELLIMLGWDSGLMDAGAGADQSWMATARLVPKLVRRLHPTFAALPDVHAHAGRLLVDVVVKCPLSRTCPLVAHLSTTPVLQALFAHMLSGCASSLSNALSVVIVLVQRFANRRLEHLERVQHAALEAGQPIPTLDADLLQLDEQQSDDITDEVVRYDDYELAAGSKADMADEDVPADERAQIAQIAREYKRTPSEDYEVLRLGEPFVSLMPHLPSIIALLQPNEEAAAAATASSAAGGPMHVPGVLGCAPFGSLRMKVVELCLVLARSRSKLLDARLAALGVGATMLRVFFEYPWNNLLHGLVESIVTSALEEPDSALTRSLFADGLIVDAFEQACQHNAAALAAGHMRMGYMGHLIRTAATVEHMLHGMPLEARAALLGAAAPRWQHFVSSVLSSELDAQQFDDGLMEQLLSGFNGDFNELSLDAASGMNGGANNNSLTHADLQHAQHMQATADEHYLRDDDDDDNSSDEYEYSSAALLHNGDGHELGDYEQSESVAAEIRALEELSMHRSPPQANEYSSWHQPHQQHAQGAAIDAAHVDISAAEAEEAAQAMAADRSPEPPTHL